MPLTLADTTLRTYCIATTVFIAVKMVHDLSCTVTDAGADQLVIRFLFFQY